MLFRSLGSTLQAAWPLLLAGLQMTLYVTSISLVIAMALGILVCLMRISKNVVLRAIAKFYVWIIRGTPMLVQAFYIYFAVPQLIQAATQSAFRIDIVTASLVTLTLNAGATSPRFFVAPSRRSTRVRWRHRAASA